MLFGRARMRIEIFSPTFDLDLQSNIYAWYFKQSASLSLETILSTSVAEICSLSDKLLLFIAHLRSQNSKT